MNINYRVVGLDPGGTTGVFQYDAEYRRDAEGNRSELLDHATKHLHFGPHEHHYSLYNYLESMYTFDDFWIVYESFEFRDQDPRERHNISLMSKEYIGVTKLFAQVRGLDKKHHIFPITAGQSKGFIPDKAKNGIPANGKLKAIPGFYEPSMKHANDGARVTANFLINKHHRSDLLKGWRDL